MHVRLYDPSDYEMVRSWWEEWRWTPLPEHALPRVGVIVSRDGIDLCAAWLVQTDSSISLIEWFISNPSIRGDDRRGCIEEATRWLCDFAKIRGFSSVVVMARNQHLISRLCADGFTVKDRNTDLLFKEL